MLVVTTDNIPGYEVGLLGAERATLLNKSK